MNPVPIEGKNGSTQGTSSPQTHGHMWGKEVEVATKLEPSPSRFWDSPVDNVCVFFREAAESLGLRKLAPPRIDHYATGNEKLKAIGHYLMRCEALGVEPILPSGGFNIEPEGTISDPEILLAKLALEYFHPKNDGKHLILEAGITFVRIFNECIHEQLAGKQSDESITITPSAIDSYLIALGEIPEKISTSVIDKPNKSGLTPRMVFAIRLLGKDKSKLTEQQKLFVANFLNTVPYNRGLNKALRSLSKSQIERYNLDEGVIYDLARISFKTREGKVFDKAFKKLQMIDQLNKAGNIIPENLRLTLHEVEVLDGHARIGDLMLKHSPYYDREKKSFDVETAANSKHIVLCRVLQKNQNMMEELTKKIVDGLNLQSGDIIQNLGKKYIGMSGGDLGFISRQFQNIRYGIAQYRHSGKVCLIDGKPHVSDMGGRYRNFPMDLANLLVSQFQRIHVDRLVTDEEMRDKLAEKYGPAWEEVINSKYRGIEERIHSDTSKKSFGKLINEVKNQARVGISYVFPFLHSARTSDRSFDKLHKKIIHGTYSHQNKAMVCSEFAAKTTIAALYELNLQLKKDLGITNPDVNVIDMPFGPREKLHFIQPDRLTAILEKAGCIDHVTSEECASVYEKYLVVHAEKGVDLPLKQED